MNLEEIGQKDGLMKLRVGTMTAALVKIVVKKTKRRRRRRRRRNISLIVPIF
jgi:hypothetical protein